MALVAARRLTLESTAARIVGALGAAGVHCVLLKGPTLSELYDGVRPYNDVDRAIAFLRHEIPEEHGGSDRGRASVDERGADRRVARHGPGGGNDGREVRLPAAVVGRAHADERRVGLRERARRIRMERQASVADPGPHELLEPGFDEGDDATPK